MDKIKILIACHKPADVPHDEVYTPIHVGKALHPEVDLGFIGDDSGDNISAKNASYCELTAQYWGWKNLKCEYIGLAHYRRFFEPVFTNDNVEAILEGNDVILASPIHFPISVDQFWMQKLIPEDVTILYLILKKYYPFEFRYAEQYLTNNLFYRCNMFICSKALFNRFAEWQFDVLSKVERVLPLSAYSRERRIMGFLSEALLPIWFFSHGFKVKTLPIVDWPGKAAIPHLKTKIKCLLVNYRIDFQFKKNKPTVLDIAGDYVAGLKQDGIVEKIDSIGRGVLSHTEHHILCLGNSITFHPYKSEIGWLSEHGMAASKPENDYCHQLEKRLKTLNPHSTVTGINIAEFETNPSCNFKILIGNTINEKDIIIIRISENVRDISRFEQAIQRLTAYCLKYTPMIYICGCVWKDDNKEQVLKRTAKRNNLSFISLDWIMEQHPETYPQIGDTLYDIKGQPYTIDKPFITTHPNDYGMAKIADIIFKTL